ncbi:NAD(P)-dependent oxidoreductase [archaeon]|jgi:UDP-glucose 4-epimerase|nr:NAD(P)-dependent oxidoreductase [archaeon]MBT4416958.1 NAD(P)-dependent oxidoreductase [archaeon]
MVKKVFVTGGRGFIGSFVIERLVNEGYDVYSFSFEDLDLTDKDKVFEKVRAIKPDCVIHLAGLTNFSLPYEKLYSVNFGCTKNVLDACDGKFIFFSSALVYAGNDAPFEESMVGSEPNDYAKTKQLAEKICLEKGGVVFRLPIVYGPGHSGTRFLSDLKNAIENDQPFVMQSSGGVTRDFLHMDDLLGAVCLAIESDVKGEVINLGTGEEVSLNEAVEIAKKKFPGLKVEKVLSHEEAVQRYVMNVSKAKELLDWSPKVFFEEGFSSLIDVNKSKNDEQ